MGRPWVGGCVLALLCGAGTVGAQDIQSHKDVFGSLQRVELSGDGAWWLSVDGHARWRAESWSGYNFGAPATADPNDLYSLGRFFLTLDVHAGSALQLVAEGKSSMASDRTLVGGRRTSDEDALDLQQGYAQLTLTPAADSLRLRVGRQEMPLGGERLVSVSDWSNTRKTFEGVTGRVVAGRWSVTALAVAPVLVQSYAFDHRDPHTLLYGAYVTDAALASRVSLDIYWLGLRRDSVTTNGTTGAEDRQTLGARLWRSAGAAGVDYSAELAGQAGSVGAARIGAWMASAQAGYTWRGAPAPRVHLGLDYASGDAAAGGTVGTFNELFGTAHRYHGTMDVDGGQNLVDLSTGVSLTWRDGPSLALNGHHFDRASRGDAFYSATLSVTRAPGVGLARHLGDELDLSGQYTVLRHLLLLAGYGHYFPGAFVAQTGSHRGINYTYFSSQLTL